MNIKQKYYNKKDEEDREVLDGEWKEGVPEGKCILY